MVKQAPMKAHTTILFLVCIFLHGAGHAEEIKAASESELETFKQKLGPLASKYFDEGGERRELFFADVNNDGKRDYLLTAREGGRMQTDTILEAFDEEGDKLVPLGMDRVMPDGSQMPLHFDDDFLVSESGKVYLHYRDDTNQSRYLWEGGYFKLVAAKKLGDKKWDKASGDGPSFPCGKATTEAERLICGDYFLSKNDLRLNNLYEKLKLVANIEKPKLVNQQREWLAKRDADCGTEKGSAHASDPVETKVNCFVAAYQQRLKDLEGLGFAEKKTRAEKRRNMGRMPRTPSGMERRGLRMMMPSRRSTIPSWAPSPKGIESRRGHSSRTPFR